MKFFGKEVDKDKFLYGGLIFTFFILYAVTAFVSFYHAITFFNIANAVWLSVLLSFVAEIGQASVLFAILLTDNKHKFLPWAVMIILTTLQVIGNVVSSYDWIVAHNGVGVDAFQKSILFWMTTADPEIFKVVIAWISGALLPIIALSMTALVAQNMELRAHDAKTNLDNVDGGDNNVVETEEKIETTEPIDASILMSEVSKIRPENELLNNVETLINQRQPRSREEIIEAIKKEEEEEENTKQSMENLQKRLEEQERQIERMRLLMSVEKPKAEISPELKETIAPGIEDYDDELQTQDIKQEAKEKEIEIITQNAPETYLPDIPAEPILTKSEEEKGTEEEHSIILADEGMTDEEILNQEVEYFTPPEPSPEIVQPPTVKHNHGLVEGMDSGLPESVQKKITEDRLEKLRQLAKEQEDLKKK